MGVRIGELASGDRFRTCITKRVGEVKFKVGNEGIAVTWDGGVAYLPWDGDSNPSVAYLHRNVIVERIVH